LTPDQLTQAERDARRFQGCWWQGTSGTLAAWIILLLKEQKQMAATLDEVNKALRDAVEARLAGAPIELPDALQGVTLTPAEPMEEATFAEPEPVSQMTPEQLDAAWSGVAQRQREMQAAIREPERAEPVARRVVELAEPIVVDGATIDRLPVLEDDKPLRPGSREFFDVLDEVRRLHLSKTLDYGVATDALSNIRQSADVVNLPAWSACVVRMADKMHRLKAFHHRGKTEFDGVPDTLLDLCAYAALALVLYREATCTKVQ
jgi:hypothetical protein